MAPLSHSVEYPMPLIVTVAEVTVLSSDGRENCFRTRCMGMASEPIHCAGTARHVSSMDVRKAPLAHAERVPVLDQ